MMNYADFKEIVKKSSLIVKSYNAILKIIYYIYPRGAIHIEYFFVFGKTLNLDEPKSLNEKINSLKFKTQELESTCADKIAVRKYVSEKGYNNILPKLYLITEQVDDIVFDEFPDKFVLKCNHGCGYNIVVKDKQKEDINNIRIQLSKWMSEKYGVMHYESHYLMIKPKILCEEYLSGLDQEDGLIDYKFYCCSGKVKIIRLITRENVKNYVPKIYHFNTNWQFIESSTEENPSDICISFKRPDKLEKMIEISEELAKPFPFVRVDLYYVNGKIYFGELTFTSGGGFDTYMSEKLDKWLGDFVKV